MEIVKQLSTYPRPKITIVEDNSTTISLANSTHRCITDLYEK